MPARTKKRAAYLLGIQDNRGIFSGKGGRSLPKMSRLENKAFSLGIKRARASRITSGINREILAKNRESAKYNKLRNSYGSWNSTAFDIKPLLPRTRGPISGAGKNLGSFKSRPGSWKKGKGGRFVGSA